MLKIVSCRLLICLLKISAILKWYNYTLQKRENKGPGHQTCLKKIGLDANEFVKLHGPLCKNLTHANDWPFAEKISHRPMRDNLTSTTSLCLIICHQYDNPMNQANPLMKSVYRSESFRSFPNGLCLPLDVASTSHPVTRSSNHK